ncbi:MAG: hypothetical protein EA428_05805 [Spirochaetaceae bacterium]|nr:MAG: hypothetical protein EA428_05805 [Spirochaetaceae bacterium]
MVESTGYTSFAHEGALISALVPDGWEAVEPAPQQVRFFGPVQTEYDDYRPTFSISLGRPDGFGEEWFDEFADDSLGQLQSEYEGFVLRSTERLSLSSLVEVNAVWYEWEPEPNLAFAQLQALAPVDRFRMYLINAATLRPLADIHLPIFDQILRSLRMLPPRQ